MIGQTAQPPRVTFERPPLKAVVAQIRFPPIFALAQPSGVAPFQEVIRELYPLSETVAETAFSLGPQAVPVSLPQGPIWRFFTDDRNWIVSVSPDSLSIETPTYRRFEIFRDRFSSVLDAAMATLHIARRTRFGLRYVNQIVHPDASRPSDWRPFLSDKLLGFQMDDLFAGQVVTSFQQIQLNLPNGKAAVRHGFIPQPNGETPYVIDLDVYDEEPKPLSREELLLLMTSYKDWVWRIFRASISDRLFEYLGPTPLVGAGGAA